MVINSEKLDLAVFVHFKFLYETNKRFYLKKIVPRYPACCSAVLQKWWNWLHLEVLAYNFIKVKLNEVQKPIDVFRLVTSQRCHTFWYVTWDVWWKWRYILEKDHVWSDVITTCHLNLIECPGFPRNCAHDARNCVPSNDASRILSS